MDAHLLSPLFSPLTVRGKTYKNRIAAAPLGNVMISLEGKYPKSAFDWYEKRAKGGCAEVMVSETPVDYDYANRMAAVPVDYTDFSSPHFQSLKKYAELLHSYGAMATVELNHCGKNRFASAGKLGPIGPSGHVREDGISVTEMDETLMALTERHFAQAALYFHKAGFDGVVPHMGSGWLLQQFLSPLTNHREDCYGGSTENRVRFPIRVLRKIREYCGEELLIIPRFCGDEGVPGGYGPEEAAQMARLMEPWVDMFHLVRGVYYEPVRSLEYPSMFSGHGPGKTLSRRIKEAVSVPVVLCGGISDPLAAAELIRKGDADMIALGRQMLADPDWAEKAQQGRADEIARCLRCYRCFPGPLPDTGGKPLVPPDKKCTVNPLSDLTDVQPPVDSWPKPEESRKVLVVGGGPGGMMAAAVAGERGHQVTLVEKAPSLGGHLLEMESDLYKKEFLEFGNMLENRCIRAGVTIQKNISATEELLRQGWDAVILALGSAPVTGVIPGSEYAVQAVELGAHLPTKAKTALILGGGLVGCETAVHLAEAGVRVEILEMQSRVAGDANPMHRVALLEKMEQCGIKVRTGAVCREIRDGAVCYAYDGEDKWASAELLITALGLRARKTEAETLASGLPEKTEVFFVGDCGGGKNIQEAVEQGYLAAMKII